MQHFHEAHLPQSLLARLEQIGFKEPTPIQSQAIPVALDGKDILGSAQTGTGKTGAFGLPLISELMKNPKSAALVLLPTRELALQVVKALQQFIGNERIPTALLIGGEPMPPQISKLRARPRLIVGTPGRINDHLGRGTLQLHQVNFLVLDEVDRMLDMGFGIQLDAIAKFLTNTRQTLMFSATMPDNINKVAAKYLKDPVRISVGSTAAVATNITQEHVKLGDSEKYPRLLDELEAREGSVIIFIKTKHGADKMASKLRNAGHRCDALHGDLRQNQRSRVVAGFRNKSYRILVATDVAARGLDIPHLAHVINYDMPQCPEDYIHRIGRTARAGAEGAAINFISPADSSKWRAIERMMNPNAGPSKADDRERKPANRSNKRFGGGAHRKGPGASGGFGGRNRDENRRDGGGFKARRNDADGGNQGGSSEGGRKPYADRRNDDASRGNRDDNRGNFRPQRGGEEVDGNREGANRNRAVFGGGRREGGQSQEGGRDGAPRRSFGERREGGREDGPRKSFGGGGRRDGGKSQDGNREGGGNTQGNKRPGSKPFGQGGGKPAWKGRNTNKSAA